jgi:hypothetical protein
MKGKENETPEDISFKNEGEMGFFFLFIHLFICTYIVGPISFPCPPPPFPPHFQAEPVLPFSPSLLKRRHKQ